MRAGFSVSVAVFAVVVLSAAAPEKDPAFETARQTFQREMKKNSPAERAAAVLAFAAFANTESAEMLFKRGQIDSAPEVRVAVRKAMQQVAEDPSARRFFFGEIQKARKKTNGDELLWELFRAVAPVNDAASQAQVAEALDEYFSPVKANWLTPMLLIDELGKQGDTVAERSIETFAKAKAFADKFGYRRCIVQAMLRIKQPAAIGFLINCLADSEGLIQLDIVRYLTRETGQRFRGNHAEWDTWWKQNSRTFEFTTADTPVVETPPEEGQPTYYRIPICAKRVVFVLDTSLSMRGPPIEAAQRALIAAVKSLPEAVALDVIMFDVRASAIKPRLLSATADFKQDIEHAVQAHSLGLGTSSNAALQLAFSLEPEAIYFLSDGEPTDGRPAQIVEAISSLNRTRRVSIHTIGVVTVRNGGFGLTQFMRPLAEQNWGTFQLVE